MPATNILTELVNLGAAGVMGAMWLWERRTSRQREEQLSESHGRIMRDEERLAKLVEVVEQNTAAVTRFTETQQFVRQALAELREEMRNGRKT
jgi:C4-dicarboxylate-specific signal transduction histidine kinase